MPLIYPVIASASDDGELIPVAATTIGSATTLHTSVSGTTDMDEITVWATNTDTAARKLTLVVTSAAGSGSAPGEISEYTVPAEGGFYLIADRIRLQNASVVEAFCATASVVNCQVSVNRIEFA